MAPPKQRIGDDVQVWPLFLSDCASLGLEAVVHRVEIVVLLNRRQPEHETRRGQAQRHGAGYVRCGGDGPRRGRLARESGSIVTAGLTIVNTCGGRVVPEASNSQRWST